MPCGYTPLCATRVFAFICPLAGQDSLATYFGVSLGNINPTPAYRSINQSDALCTCTSLAVTLTLKYKSHAMSVHLQSGVGTPSDSK